MKNKVSNSNKVHCLIKITSISLLLIFTLHSLAKNDLEIVNQLPSSISDVNNSEFKAAILKDKLLPTPHGNGGERSAFGRSFAIDGNRALIGANVQGKTGVVYFFEYENGQWVKKQTLTPQGERSFSGFGVSVSLNGDKALIGATGGSGASFIFEYDGEKWEQTNAFFDELPSGSYRLGYSVLLTDDFAFIGEHKGGGSQALTGKVKLYKFDGENWIQQISLFADDGSRNDEFGFSLSYDNNTLMIGAPGYDSDPFINNGAGYIFEYNGEEWIENENILTNQKFRGFGSSISLMGNTVLIGAEDNSAYIFEFEDGSWSEKQKLTPSNTLEVEHFGQSVYLNDNAALIGAPDYTNSSAYIFTRQEDNWVQTQILSPQFNHTSNRFGNAVGMNENRVFVGAYGNNEVEYRSGAMYEFESIDDIWLEKDKIIPDTGAAFDEFGISVSLFGQRALVGAYLDNENESNRNSGSAYIFDFKGGAWILSQKLIPDGAIAGDLFGFSVSLGENRALIGAVADDINLPSGAPKVGSAYVFDFDGTNWVQTQKLTSDITSSYNQFGYSVSLSGDRVLIGAKRDPDNSAYIFDFDGSDWTLSQKVTVDDLSNGSRFGSSVSILGDKAMVGDFRNFAGSPTGTTRGSVHFYEFNGDSWTLSQNLFPDNIVSNNDFGASISMNENRVLIGASGERNSDIASQNGAVYIFELNDLLWEKKHRIIANDSRFFEFGSSVSLIGDKALIGDTQRSTAYLFYKRNNEWYQHQKIHNTGNSVSLGNTGEFGLGGFIREGINGNRSGSVNVYEFVDDTIFSADFEH